MKTTKVFTSGNSQAVRLPRDFHLKGSIVEIIKRDGDIIIREIPDNLAKAFMILIKMPDDFFQEGREDSLPQERKF